VLKIRQATPVPHAKDHVTGMISLRGTVLPVIDLTKRLGLAAGTRDDKSRIVVVGLDDEEAGLIVDRVTGVVRFLPNAIEPVPETVEQGRAPSTLPASSAGGSFTSCWTSRRRRGSENDCTMHFRMQDELDFGDDQASHSLRALMDPASWNTASSQGGTDHEETGKR
jgi:hypothetical protein